MATSMEIKTTQRVIAPATTMGAVSLSVADLARSLAYYQTHIGLTLLEHTKETAALGVGSTVLLRLREFRGAQLMRRATGLYHFALRVPTRRDLARVIQHFADSGTRVGGASDHLVSEALYLSDPDGHGIEIYRDRPRETWLDAQGNLRGASNPLDVQGVLGELSSGELSSGELSSGELSSGELSSGELNSGELNSGELNSGELNSGELNSGELNSGELNSGELNSGELSAHEPAWTGLPMGTDMGHMHLQIANKAEAERFYVGVLGFEVRGRMPSASFVSAGGYHHHIGMNTWAGVGVPPPPEFAARLLSYEIVLPNPAALSEVTDRVRAAGLLLDESTAGWTTRDPSHNQIVLRA